MNVKCVPFKITVEGKEFDAFITEKHWEEIIKAVGKNNMTGYERVASNDDYYWDDGLIIHTAGAGYGSDKAMYECGNYYSDKTVAENNSRADRLMRQLRRFAVEHRKILDWEDISVYKYSIVYDLTTKDLCWDFTSMFRGFNEIYFDSEEIANLAIETFHDELIWYFTEYKDSL